MPGPVTVQPLQYLEFDTADDGGQACSFDAMASVTAAHLPALLAEVGGLLDWLALQFGPPGPLDDGADWDLELQASQDTVQPLQTLWQGGPPRLSAGGGAAIQRTTLTLALALREGPAQALRAILPA